MPIMEPPLDPVWVSLLRRARAGSMLSPGEPGSAGWQPGAAIPRILILCDLLVLSPGGTDSDSPPETKSISISAGNGIPDFPPQFSSVEELDLSGNGLDALPSNIHVLENLKCLFLGGGEDGNANRVPQLPDLKSLSALENLSVHDTALRVLPSLPAGLKILRLDRCPLEPLDEKADLPVGLTTLHLEGCPWPGSLERPELLPRAVKDLQCLEDLQLPDGGHVGVFFGTPLPELLEGRGVEGGE